MGDIVEALRNLAVAMGCAQKLDNVPHGTIAEIVQFIASNYPGGSSRN